MCGQNTNSQRQREQSKQSKTQFFHAALQFIMLILKGTAARSVSGQHDAAITPPVKSSASAFSGWSCDTLPTCMDPQWCRREGTSFTCTIQLIQLFSSHTSSHKGLQHQLYFALTLHKERNLTCFVGNLPRAAANTPSEQIKVGPTQTLERERSFVHAIWPSAAVGTNRAFI